MKLIAALVSLAAALAVILSIVGDGQSAPARAADTSVMHHRTVLNTPIRGHRFIIIYGLPRDARNLYTCTERQSGALDCTKNTIPVYPN